MRDLQEALTTAKLVMKFGEVERATIHPDGRPETDTTHSVMLGIVAARVATREVVPLDLGRLLLFALVHDLPEAYAGDTNTMRALDADQRAEKARREAEALDVIRQDVPWIAGAVEMYERQDTPEARFIRYLDKIMPKLTHYWNGCAVPKAGGMTTAELYENHRTQGALLAEMYPEFIYLHGLFRDACEFCEDSWGAQ